MGTPNPDRIVLVCAADNAFAMQLAVMVRSVVSNLSHQRELLLFVIDGGIKNSNKQKIYRSLGSSRIDIRWLSPDNNSLSNLKISGHIQLTTYYRLLVPDLLPTTFEKVIYLDCDIIVLGDLAQVWDIDFGTNFLLAVQDMGEPYVSSPRALNNFKELEIPEYYKYFNAGFMMMNLNRWRAEQINRKVIAYIEQNKDTIRWWDQDGLNAIMAFKWRELDPRWNQIPHIFDYPSWEKSPFEEEVYKGIISDPFIIHFATSSKPWHYNCTHPLKNEFFRYLDKTAWEGWRPKKPFQETFWRYYLKKISYNKRRLMRFIQRLARTIPNV